MGGQAAGEKQKPVQGTDKALFSRSVEARPQLSFTQAPPQEFLRTSSSFAHSYSPNSLLPPSPSQNPLNNQSREIIASDTRQIIIKCEGPFGAKKLPCIVDQFKGRSHRPKRVQKATYPRHTNLEGCAEHFQSIATR